MYRNRAAPTPTRRHPWRRDARRPEQGRDDADRDRWMTSGKYYWRHGSVGGSRHREQGKFRGICAAARKCTIQHWDSINSRHAIWPTNFEFTWLRDERTQYLSKYVADFDGRIRVSSLLCGEPRKDVAVERGWLGQRTMRGWLMYTRKRPTTSPASQTRHSYYRRKLHARPWHICLAMDVKKRE